MNAHIRITLRRLDHSRVERGAADRVDALVRIAIVRRKMQIAGFVVNHAPAHRDRVLHYFISDAELLERMNSAGGKRKIDRAPADDVPLARVSPSFVKIDLVSARPKYAASSPPARPLPIRT